MTGTIFDLFPYKAFIAVDSPPHNDFRVPAVPPVQPLAAAVAEGREFPLQRDPAPGTHIIGGGAGAVGKYHSFGYGPGDAVAGQGQQDVPEDIAGNREAGGLASFHLVLSPSGRCSVLGGCGDRKRRSRGHADPSAGWL